jgi:hypothetical protein
VIQFRNFLQIWTDSSSLLHVGHRWKPFHKDSHAYGANGEKEDFTVGVSFGAERALEFQHDGTGVTFGFPQNNGDLFAFSSVVNNRFKHGVPKAGAMRARYVRGAGPVRKAKAGGGARAAAGVTGGDGTTVTGGTTTSVTADGTTVTADGTTVSTASVTQSAPFAPTPYGAEGVLGEERISIIGWGRRKKMTSRNSGKGVAG